MRSRLFIGFAVSLGVNFLIFAIIVWMAVSNNIPLEKLIPVDFIKIEVEKPKPTPPPPPPKPKKKKKEEKKIEPTKAPIEADPDPNAVGTIQSAPEIKDPPVPKIVNFTELDFEPKITKFVKPAYPTIAKRAGKQGVVVVKFLITKSGGVTNVKVIKAPKGLGFAEAALAAVKQWRFQVPKINGQSVNAWCIKPIRFKLE